MIDRNQYIKKLLKYKDKKLIKVLTGLRRSGKSTIMDLYQKALLERGVYQDQIIHINFEDFEYIDLLEARPLYAYLMQRIAEVKTKDRMIYVFLDEVQQVEDFERVIDSLYIKENIDLYITGSNASLLSGELSTLLSGRYVEVMVLPLSFKEYAEIADTTTTKRELYNKFTLYGGLPYVTDLEDDADLIRGYLEGVFSTVVLKDVVARKKVADVLMLESVIRFIFDAIGSIVSIKKISDTMTSAGRKISAHTVESYIEGLTESFVLFPVKRYDLKGKQHLKTLEKYYLSDLGLRYLKLGTRNIDLGHILENVVFLELKRRGYELYVGKVDAFEIDFVAVSPVETLYYQVAYTVSDQETLERELRPLKMVPDHFPKFIITMDEVYERSYDGIKLIYALDFLMETY